MLQFYIELCKRVLTILPDGFPDVSNHVRDNIQSDNTDKDASQMNAIPSVL